MDPERGTAHRVSYYLANGRLPADGLILRHKCDNRLCVNPMHLEEGTFADNTNDMMERGRHAPVHLPGEENPSVKLTWEIVEAIRSRSAAGESDPALAAEYGVHRHTIYLIKTNKTWKPR